MFVTNKIVPFFSRIASAPQTREALALVSLAVLAISMPTLAQDSFDLPAVTIPGVTASSSTTEIIQNIIKYGGRFVLWALVLAAGVIYIKSTIKCVAKVRRDDEGKWGEVFGEVIGGAIAVILIIALATWVTATFLA